MNKNQNLIKEFYHAYDDKIIDKRYNSPYPLRRYVTRMAFHSICKYVSNLDRKILDAGCGDGILDVLIARRYSECHITAIDISLPNLERAKKLASTHKINNIVFQIADTENLPFDDNTFDLVISSQVLEHLPNFQKGLNEIYRVTKEKAIIALPTSFNLCALSLLGGAEYWWLRKRTLIAIPLGMLRFIKNLFNNGVDEHYAGKAFLPHIWYYPWIMKKELKRAGFKIIKFEALSLCLPYFNFLLPIIKWLDKHKDKPLLNMLGCGSIAIVKKPTSLNGQK